MKGDDRGDVDDLSRPLASHMRKREPRNTQRREHINREVSAVLGIAEYLDRLTFQAEEAASGDQ